MADTRFAVLTLPMDMESIAKPRELIIDYARQEIYVKSEDGLNNILIGSGKYGELRSIEQVGTLTQNTNTIPITFAGYNPEVDLIKGTVWLYIGGIRKSLGIEYNIVDYNIISLEGDWLAGYDYTFVLIKTITTMSFNEDFLDSSMIVPNSITDSLLSNIDGQIKDRLQKHIDDVEIHQTPTSMIIADEDIPGVKYQLTVKSGVINLRVVET